MADAVTGPSASCVQAHNQQIANNRAIIREDRAAVAELDRVIPQAADQYHAARGVYEGRYNLWDRQFSNEAAAFYRQNVLRPEVTLNRLQDARARRAATADAIERLTKGLEERGPQRSGECSPIAPNHILQPPPIPGPKSGVPGSSRPPLPSPVDAGREI